MITNFDKLCGELEQQELESLTGVLTATAYAQLLSIYIYQNDLCNAKFLWKRISKTTIAANTEISAVWAVGQKLWKKDLPGTYMALSAYNWTEPVATIINELRERIRERCFNLIGRSYSTIATETLVSMSGLSREAALQACRDRKWQVSDDTATVRPLPPTQPAPLHTSSEDQLFKLTDFVSFLEN